MPKKKNIKLRAVDSGRGLQNDPNPTPAKNRKRRRFVMKIADIIIILLCMAGSISSGTAFWREYNRTLTKLNEAPIGTITYKKRTAQRKFLDRAVWDRLKQATPLYNGDTIRTIEFSEAVILFRDEVTNLSLNENTLVQIFYDDKFGARINLVSGNVNIFSGTKSVTVTTDSSEVIVQGEADLNKRDSGISVSVMDGSASYDGERVERGNILALDSRGRRDTRPAIAMVSGGPSINNNNVEFSWISSNFNDDTTVIIEIARDRRFRQIVGTAEAAGDVSSAVISVDSDGSFWWRAYPADENKQPVNTAFPVSTLEIAAQPPAITQITEEPARPPVTAPQPAPVRRTTPPPRPTPVPPEPQPAPLQPALLPPEPQPESAAAPQTEPEPMPPPTYEPIITQPPQPAPQPDTDVQIIAEDPVPVDRLRQTSGTGTITDTYPHDGYIIYTEQLRYAPSLYFSWTGNAEEYLFAIYNADGEPVVPPTPTSSTTAIINNPAFLTEGDYVWHIYERENGLYQELPNTAKGFTVRDGTALRTLPTINPGDLYGLE